MNPPSLADAPHLSPLEIACGTPFADQPAVAAPPERAPAGGAPRSPLSALEDAVEPAVRRAPCLVSFSGGLDSSLVLCAAVRVARRGGLPDPVPITWRVADAPAAQESGWQELVVAALGLADWERLDAGEQLDLLGPVAQAVLRRRGLLYPANSFFHQPLLAAAAGGALLTGIGGDQTLGLWQRRPAVDLACGRARPTPAVIRAALNAGAPARVRRAAARRSPPAWPWLRPAARERAIAHWVEDRTGAPLTWAAQVVWQNGRRAESLGRQALALLAADAGATVHSPLRDGEVARAVAAAGGRRGYGDRRATVSALFGDLLPAQLLQRRGKATFNEVFLRTASRRFVAGLDGAGLDQGIVDVEVLRSRWSQGPPPWASALLVQQAWLAAAGS